MNDGYHLLVVTNKGKLMTVITIGCVPAAAAATATAITTAAATGTTPNKLYNVLPVYTLSTVALLSIANDTFISLQFHYPCSLVCEICNKDVFFFNTFVEENTEQPEV